MPHFTLVLETGLYAKFNAFDVDLKGRATTHNRRCACKNVCCLAPWFPTEKDFLPWEKFY